MFPGTASPTARFLAAQTWFASLPHADQERVAGSLLHHTGRRGDVMLLADAPVEGWYAVLSGLVKLQTQIGQWAFIDLFVCGLRRLVW